MTARPFIRDVELFRDLTDAQVARLADSARAETARKGEVIYRDGDPADRLYAIHSGVVEIGRTGRGGRFVRLARLERGEAFGALGLLDGGTRVGTALAAVVPETRLVSWDAAALEKIIAEDPALGQILLRVIAARLAGRLRAASDAVFTLLQALPR
jgi:glutaminase